MKIKESLENALDYQLKEDNNDRTVYEFNLKQDFDIDLKIEVRFKFVGNIYSVDFYNNGEYRNLSSQKQASFAIFATLVQIINEFVETKNINILEAVGNSAKKSDIYEKLFKRFAEGWTVNQMGNLFQVKKIENNET